MRDILDRQRSAWLGHDAFSSQVLLVESHNAFCRIADDIVERLALLSKHDDAMSPKRRGRLLKQTGARFAEWMWAMRSHEGYEERKLYPFLEHRFGDALDHLRSGHDHLHRQADAVNAAFELAILAASAPEAVPGWPHLDGALMLYLGTLTGHLLAEEAAVIPRLLSLSPEEFRVFSSSSIAELLPKK